MARNPKVGKKKSQDRRPKSGGAAGRPRRGRPKICIFCSEHATWVDYKDVPLLRRFVNDRGRIKARGATGTCAQHQRDVATAVKTARELALLPYAVRTSSSEARGDRRQDRGGSARGSSSPGSSEAQAEGPASDTSAPSDGEEVSESGEAADSPAEARA